MRSPVRVTGKAVIATGRIHAGADVVGGRPTRLAAAEGATCAAVDVPAVLAPTSGAPS